MTALESPNVRQKLGGEGTEIVAGKPGEFGAFLKRDIDKWRAVVKSANTTVD